MWSGDFIQSHPDTDTSATNEKRACAHVKNEEINVFISRVKKVNVPVRIYVCGYCTGEKSQ